MCEEILPQLAFKIFSENEVAETETRTAVHIVVVARCQDPSCL